MRRVAREGVVDSQRSIFEKIVKLLSLYARVRERE